MVRPGRSSSSVVSQYIITMMNKNHPTIPHCAPTFILVTPASRSYAFINTVGKNMADEKKSAFSDFVESKSKQEDKIDWDGKKDLWLQKVNDLYADIQSWMAEYITKGQVLISNESITLTEEYIGTYQAPALRIKIGAERIDITPVGTLIIGGNGRVDITGKAGKTMLILSHKDYRPGVTVHVATSDEERTEFEEKQKEERKNRPQLTRENLIWLYVRRTPQMEYFPLTKDIFEDILMSTAGR